MTLEFVASESHIVIETAAAGLLAAAAHDLRIVAEHGSGKSDDENGIEVSFPISKLRVEKSRRHGSKGEWETPKPSDQSDIESRICSEVFADGKDGAIVVVAKISGECASLFIRAPRGEERVTTAVTLERNENEIRATGSCSLSLAALGTGKVKIPLGAVKLADGVKIDFDVVLKRVS